MNGDADETVRNFLVRAGWADATLSGLEEAGASLRWYQRVLAPDGRTAILTHVADVKSEIVRFTEISTLLRDMGLSAPEVYCHDETAKLLLQEDFGNDSFSRLIARGSDARILHLRAVDVLLAIQDRFTGQAVWADRLLHYDFNLWRTGLSNFFLHYLPCVGRENLTAGEQADYLSLWRKVLAPFEALPGTLLMRDFKPANLMLLPNRTGLKEVGIIDFQDAGLGSPLYDLVELTQSWQHELPAGLAEAVLTRYGQARPELSPETIRSGCMAFGAVRWISWLSSCARYAREGRPQFLANIPGIWRAADQCLADPALAELRGWFGQYAPASLRAPQQVAA